MKKEFNPKALTQSASSIVKANFGRVQAIIVISLFMTMLLVLAEQLFTSLIENYGRAIELPFLSNADLFSSIVGLLLAIFFFFLSTPLNIGIKKWYFTQVRNSGEEYVGIIFGYYKTNSKYVNSLMFELNKIARLLIYFVISFAPSAALFALAFDITDEGLAYSRAEQAGGLAFAALLLLIAGVIIYVMLSLKYFLAPYFFVAKQFAGVSECFSKSSQYMKGHKGLVVKLVMSNLKYYILSLLIFPLVYTLPLHEMCMANCAKTIISYNEKD